MIKKKITLPNGSVLEVTKEDSFAILQAALAACQSFQELSKKLASRFKCVDCKRLRKYKINSCRRHQVDQPPLVPNYFWYNEDSRKNHRNKKQVEDEANVS